MEDTIVEDPEKGRGIKRIIKAAGYSISGIASALKHEQAFQQEFILSLILIPIALILPFSLSETAILLMSLVFILTVELLNSAIEWVVDYISLEKHPFAKRAKDMASAAVFLSLLNCISLWCFFMYGRWSEVLNCIREMF